MKDASALMRLLGDEARLRLLRILAREPLNVTELTAVMGLAQSGVSRHLGLLRDAKLVTEEKSGHFTWYRLHPDVTAAVPFQDGEYLLLCPWRISVPRLVDDVLPEVVHCSSQDAGDAPALAFASSCAYWVWPAKAPCRRW